MLLQFEIILFKIQQLAKDKTTPAFKLSRKVTVVTSFQEKKRKKNRSSASSNKTESRRWYKYFLYKSSTDFNVECW